jgi:hypothetical protein
MSPRAIPLLIGAALAALVALPAVVAAQSTPRCAAGDLAGAIIDVQGAAGSRDGRLILVNTASRTCHSKGFIGGQLVGTDGRSLTTHVQRDHRTTSRTVQIKSGAAAVLTVHWNVIPSGDTPCPKARWLRVTPPDDTKTVRVYFGDTACRGRLTVGPLTNPATVG